MAGKVSGGRFESVVRTWTGQVGCVLNDTLCASITAVVCALAYRLGGTPHTPSHPTANVMVRCGCVDSCVPLCYHRCRSRRQGPAAMRGAKKTAVQIRDPANVLGAGDWELAWPSAMRWARRLQSRFETQQRAGGWRLVAGSAFSYALDRKTPEQIRDPETCWGPAIGSWLRCMILPQPPPRCVTVPQLPPPLRGRAAVPSRRVSVPQPPPCASTASIIVSARGFKHTL